MREAGVVLQLLWIEVIVKAVLGALLALFPKTLARVLGLPVPAETLWPRLFGAVLLGMAAASLLEGQLETRNGLGLAGHVAVNLAAVLAIVGTMITGRASNSRWGRIVLGLTAAGLTILALVELAWA
jgi:hypothetical protein